MKTTTLVVALALLAGCAGQDEKETTSKQDITQAVRDFIEVRELESLDQLRSGTNDGWRVLGDMFVIYDGRRDEYLVEFVRRCHELHDNTRITADKRWDSNVVRARFDTIRGCRIAAIYALDEAEVAELKNIGEAPGSRN
jgi:hypothetical protein